jgi:cytoskeleton protein RodZ
MPDFMASIFGKSMQDPVAQAGKPRAHINDLGSELRRMREEKGISLSEAEQATRIRARYLQALEVNDWASLPTQVQARGFLRNYAVYLGLDEEQVMTKYSQATRSAEVSVPPPAAAGSPVPTTREDGAVFRPRNIDIERQATMPSWLSSDIIIGVALALVVAAVGLGLLRLAFSDGDETSSGSVQEPALTPVLGESTPMPTSSVGLAPGEATPTFDANIGAVQLDLESTEHVWVRVTVDGSQMLEGVLAPNSPQTWRGTELIVLETANGAGLEAVVNGQPQGPLGERGQAIVLAWGPSGQVSITPTASP